MSFYNLNLNVFSYIPTDLKIIKREMKKLSLSKLLVILKFLVEVREPKCLQMLKQIFKLEFW